jgi:hypothetical protein
MKITDILSKVTLPLKYKIVLAIGTAAALFVPREITSRFFGFALEGLLRTTIGVLFLIFSSFSIAELIYEFLKIVGKGIKGAISERRSSKQLIRDLHSLSDKEQEYLATFQRDNTISQNMPYNDGITQSLVGKKIISLASQVSESGLYFPYNINPKVWAHIKEHPELLKNAMERLKTNRR